MKSQPIPLAVSQPAPTDRLIKRSALVAFRYLRAANTRAKTIPGLITLALNDVQEAWRESSRPNV